MQTIRLWTRYIATGVVCGFLSVLVSSMLFVSVDAAQKFSPARSLNNVPKSIALGFQRRGKVQAILVNPGTQVKAGAPLVELDASELMAQLKDTRALADVQKARLKVAQAAKPADVSRLDAVKIDDAKTALRSNQKNLLAVVRDAYVKSDDAVRAKGDQIFTRQYQLAVPTSDSQQAIVLSDSRQVLERVLLGWRDGIAKTQPEDAVSLAMSTERTLVQVMDFMDGVASIINQQPTDTTTLTTIRNWKSDVFTARSNLATVLRTLFSAEQLVQDAQSKLAQLQSTASVPSTSTDTDVAYLQAQINETEARAGVYETQLKQMTLTSPVAGTVVEQRAQLGTIVDSGPIITIQPTR